MAVDSSQPWRKGDSYETLTGVFVDGFNVKVGPATKVAANKLRAFMKNVIQMLAGGLPIKNIYPREL